MTQAAFDKQIPLTLKMEGGYANDPHDSGGETNFGISKRSYPTIDIKSLTEAGAMSIYQLDYWHRPHFDLLPDAFAGKVFDLGVNMGPGTATKLLQQALRDANPARRLAIDGRLGPITLEEAEKADGEDILNRLRELARQRYLKIVQNRPDQSRFLRGWLRRASA